ncbi:MAG: 4-hydroxy-tetrahydrodipicolinate reductase [Saprospiraceae bacterium]|nr:MAG: 4-hydroxy-tetrahydrodipicolinate reductase [Saprospiraceae bacterium]
MKIALIGFGKMGKAIERLALRKSHNIVLKIDLENKEELTTGNLQGADVAIEFSRPEVAFGNIAACLNAGVPVVSGTTGWLSQLGEAKELCHKTGGAFLHASNFSIGVNIFFALSRQLAAMMELQNQYDVAMEEIHHTQKLDAPSGTAITLAEGILRQLSRKKKWVCVEGEGGKAAPVPGELVITSKRIDQVAGTHIIRWDSAVDSIEIRHSAHSREGFAAGALAAAAWLVGKKGCFEMKDMLGF